MDTSARDACIHIISINRYYIFTFTFIYSVISYTPVCIAYKETQLA